MRIERDQLFRELTPPAGGAARLRARLAAEVSVTAEARVSNAAQARASGAAQARASNRELLFGSWHVAAAGVAAVLVIAVLVALAFRNGASIDGGFIDGTGVAGNTALPGGELYASSDFDRLLGRSSTPFELSVSLGDEQLALTEIPTGDPLVRIVQIEEGLLN